jgi:hypothetical protein
VPWHGVRVHEAHAERLALVSNEEIFDTGWARY